MKKLILATALFAVAVFGVQAQQPAPPANPARVPAITPVSDAMLQNPDPNEWLMWRRTLNGWGFSPLDQIKKSNVKDLRMAWTRGLTAGIQEGTPLVHNGVMFIPNPGDDIMAVDAKTGDLIWEYKRKLPEGVRGKTNRAIAMWGTTLINSSSDNFIYALDMSSGKLVWETPVLSPKMRAPTSGGPIIANGKVITGRQCQPDATRDSCVITAHDVKTGKELWRFHTIPGPGEPGDESWGGIPMEQRWHVGTWMVPSYDPELNLVIIGTSVTIPAPKFTLAGADKQYLFHNCTLAINADTGKLVWYYQHIVDHWDLDHPFERLLVDTVVAPSASEVRWINPKVRAGERRKVVTGIPGKTGVVYTLDRQTGEFLWARPTVAQNVISNIDPSTGKVIVNPEVVFTKLNDERFVCPGSNGGKNWPAGAYSPLTNVMYMPLQNLCMTATTTTDQRDPSKVYGINMKSEFAIGADKVGTVWAIAADTGKTLWKHEQRAGTLSLVATGGGLVFGGDANGRFKAYDDKTGQVLWETIVGSASSGYPITYSVGGKQYVAIITGPSLAAQTDERQTPEYTPANAPNIFVFALP
jgi:PQQ-dependent dehydrogenase (methanol/ethanol family)